jgi:hypothetical protein
MQNSINLAKISLSTLLLLILAGGCASSSVAPASRQVQPGAVYSEQVPITDYMRSQVGTPNELSPIAPAEARNIRKVGNRWYCDLNGQVRVFNSATSCWELQQK